MSDYEIFEFLESDYKQEMKVKRRRKREYNDPFDMDEREFIREYRLTPDLVQGLCEELMATNPNFAHKRAGDINLETKVLTAIYIYAHGTLQKRTAQTLHMSQQTVSRALAEVTAALNNDEIRNKYIKFPQNVDERQENKLRFYLKFGIPGVVGCIGGTHVAILRPTEQAETYVCPVPTSYHSLNVQLVCNADMDIISVDACNPGASDNADIWSNHPLRSQFKNLSSTEPLWLLGDSSYPLEKTMMTPIADPEPGSPEDIYNKKHVSAHKTIEKTIHALKSRFRCLLADRPLHYQPPVAGNIVNACVILHNMCNAAGLSVPKLAKEEVLREESLQPEMTVFDSEGTDEETKVGFSTRQDLVESVWERTYCI
ncbi:hypothetical protein ABMA27_008945 [Loxostege sticticalis]|uniref:DDE Tnp4 domain-containing protein n=1 Tax=Loxostege sticticalis TaxID=481309 RepID=A0ABR3H9D5_LOXSC